MVAGCGDAAEPNDVGVREVRIVSVDGAPPFEVETTSIEHVADQRWTHALRIAGPSDTSIAVATDAITIDLTGEIVSEGRHVPGDIAIVAPGGVETITVHVPMEAATPTSGLHEKQTLVPFWYDVDAVEPEFPDGVASVTLEYRVS